MKAPAKNRVEWVVFVFGALLTLASLVWLVREEVVLRNEPAQIAAHVGKIRNQEGSFRVEVDVRNTGGRTAELVRLRVESAGEQADLELAFLPRGSTRRVVATFREEPLNPHVRVLGFVEP